MVTLLGPFIKFVILEPQQSAQFTQVRGQLSRSLLTGSKVKATKERLLDFLLDLVPCLQVRKHLVFT